MSWNIWSKWVILIASAAKIRVRPPQISTFSAVNIQSRRTPISVLESAGYFRSPPEILTENCNSIDSGAK